MSLKIIHDLSKLTEEQEAQYLRDVSTFIGLDPDLNGLDTIWMPNENGPGQSKVVYARRGTAEILREIHGIEVSSLTSVITPESAVFTATGRNAAKRQEIAIGSKSLRSLGGQAYDNAVMTASTRALRRLTMQFTKLGILDQSEIEGIKAESVNPAAGAMLSGSAVVLPPAPTVPANNAPGRDVTKSAEPAGYGIADQPKLAPASTEPVKTFATHQQELIDEAMAQHQAIVPKADINPDIPTLVAPVIPVSAPVTVVSQPDIKAAEIAPEIVSKPKRARKARNTVSMDGPEPEVVSTPAPTLAAPISVPAPVSIPVETVPKTENIVPVQVNAAVPIQAVPAVPISGTSVPNQGTDFEGKPTDAQMGDYRKRVGVYTAELPSSENMGSVQKMRAFITRMSGAAPQFMTTDQWEEMLGWFEAFVAKNAVKGLVKYINDSLGVK